MYCPIFGPPAALRHFRPYLGRFKRSEDGAVTIFACFMIFILMMVSGIGVDMMRHEMERTRIQAVADRAVLAAADLDQTRDATEVVNDYFSKAGMSDFVFNVDPDVGLNYKIVSVESGTTFNTQFMDYLGVETLSVAAAATAEERVPNAEIALVLDISSSMKRTGRLDALKPAAVEFVNTVLADDVKTTTSLTLVPFGGQVNPGPEMFARLGGMRLDATALDESEGGISQDDTRQNVRLAENEEGGEGSDTETKYVFPNLSSCLETDISGFGTVGLPSATSYEQTPYFHYWNLNQPEVQHWGWCPRDEFSIQYHTNDRDRVNAVINSFRTYDGTGTHYAMKWATALLDDGAQDDVTYLVGQGIASSDFLGRPAAYSDSETTKFVVLMTDGEISHQYRPVDEFDPRNPTERLGQGSRKNTDVERTTHKNDAVADFLAQCELAKSRSPKPIVVYTINFEGNSGARDQMKACASSESHYFTADTNNIAATFKSIARQINQLRLTN